MVQAAILYVPTCGLSGDHTLTHSLTHSLTPVWTVWMACTEIFAQWEAEEGYDGGIDEHGVEWASPSFGVPALLQLY